MLNEHTHTHTHKLFYSIFRCPPLYLHQTHTLSLPLTLSLSLSLTLSLSLFLICVLCQSYSFDYPNFEIECSESNAMHHLGPPRFIFTNWKVFSQIANTLCLFNLSFFLSLSLSILQHTPTPTHLSWTSGIVMKNRTDLLKRERKRERKKERERGETVFEKTYFPY